MAARTDVTYDWPDLILGGIPWLGPATILQVWGDGQLLATGLAFSVPALLILLTHELGHFLACKRYGIPATWPHFIPLPIAFGTLGAFIRIRAPIRTKRELFDVGIAGPLAGFAALLPFLLYGVARSEIVAQETAPWETANAILLLPGKSLLFQIVQWAFHGPAPDGTVLELHPFAMAAWLGLLVTCLNLIPLGQLDGGHLLYALLGARQRTVAPYLLALLLAAGYFFWPGWFVWGALVLFMGLRHPPVRNEHLPLDRRRRLMGLLALLVFGLSFMPVPLDAIPVAY